MLSKIGEIFSAFKLSITIPTIYLDHWQRNKGTPHMRETADIVNFHIGKLATSEISPFLSGFCGDFVLGVEQLAGTVQSPLRTAKTSE